MNGTLEIIEQLEWDNNHGNPDPLLAPSPTSSKKVFRSTGTHLEFKPLKSIPHEH